MMVAFACLELAPAHSRDRQFVVSAEFEHSIGTKWQSVQRRLGEDETRLAACRAETWMCSDEEARLQAIVDLGRSHEGRARIGSINRAVNLTIRPVSDERQFGRDDHWSAPLETMASGQGDCEDYAILKLLALQQAGIDRNDLRLIIVKASGSQNAHAVAAARLDGRWLMLDNHILTLVDIEQTPYRVLAHLVPEGQSLRFAEIESDANPAGVM
jgi:predicted transglutaminase-like cysteine proteinase